MELPVLRGGSSGWKNSFEMAMAAQVEIMENSRRPHQHKILSAYTITWI
jgi:hypothetical protein